MGAKTGIEWTDATWNPILGCSRVSEGCRNCYAEGIAGRFGNGKETVYSGLTQIVNGRAVWTGKIVETRRLLQPLSWRKPKRVFANSMSDLFHENVTDEQRDRIFAVMALCPQHTFQVLTKRPERMLEYLSDLPDARTEAIQGQITEIMLGEMNDKVHARVMASLPHGWGGLPLPNVWLGVSVEDQATADDRIESLLRTPAAVRFLSCEPLLGPVCLHGQLYKDAAQQVCCADCRRVNVPAVPFPNWVIVGGESGPGARPMHPDWARSLRDQCVAANVPFFFKQWGEWTPGENVERSSGRVPVAGWLNNRWTVGFENLANDEGHIDDEPDLYRVGKKAAGALLDGREWKEFPCQPE